jgi:hypothetical protein
MKILEDVKATPKSSSDSAEKSPFVSAKSSTHGAVVSNNTIAPVPDTPQTRATADAQLGKPYAIALATHSYHTSIAPPDVQVAPDSTLGRWRALLDSAFKNPGFLAWAKEQGLDLKSFKLDPYLGELTGIANGKMQTFSLKDDSGWADISRVLLLIARAIAPMPGQAFNYPWPDGKVPLYTVGRFYGEPIDLSPSQAAAHRKKLKEGASFEFAPLQHASQRSVEALAKQDVALGDDANRHALLGALRSLKDDAEGKIDLNNIRVPIDRRSSLYLTEQRQDMSLAKLLEKERHKLPGNSAQAHALADALSFDLAHRAPGTDAGGVRHIAGLLSQTSVRKMKAVVGDWKLKHASQTPEPQAGPGAGSLLHSLISRLSPSARKEIAHTPSSVLDQLIRLPEAQALGNAIQVKLTLAASPTAGIEALTAALVQELSPDSERSCFNLAGYNLYQSENAGASAAEIVKRFTAYLETKVGVEAAPLAAQLLLSAVAPEFLVKDIPPNLVYGSHTWASFSTAVALVEQEASGASGNMTFSQVITYAEAQLGILDGDIELAAASKNAVTAWGLANQVIKSNPKGQYTLEDVERSQKALEKQKKELKWARAELLKPVPTRREVALAEFKRVFPGVDPTKATLRSSRDDKYVVSPLDVYMTKSSLPDWLGSWVSKDEKELPWESMKPRFSELDDNIDKQFSDQFGEYTKSQAAARAVLFKYHLSLLPVAEQERINKSDVTFIGLSRPFLGTELKGNTGLSLYPARVPRKPTPHELKELEGGQGVLMKLEGADGKVEYFSYYPKSGKFIKEQGVPQERVDFDDSRYFPPGTETRLSGTYDVFKKFGETNQKRDSPDVSDEEKIPYFSRRNGSLASAVGEFFTKNFGDLKEVAYGETIIEKNIRGNKSVNEFLLSLIPFYDGIDDAIKGNVAGAVFNIGFDILGFLIPGFSAAKKAATAGKPLGKILKRSLLAGVGSSIGVTDAMELPKNVYRGLGAIGKDAKKLYKHADEILPRLKGNYRSYDVTKTYKEGDIVKGVHQVDSDGVRVPVIAIFTKGGWYAYSTVVNTPFGPQLAQFGILSATLPKPK